MPTDLSPSEQEERQVERLIDKKPAPSRKPAERRGPKHDCRRDRMETDDPDMKDPDQDMSLNYKYSSFISGIAIRLAAAKRENPTRNSPSDNSPKIPKEAPRKKTVPEKTPERKTVPEKRKDPVKTKKQKDPISEIKESVKSVTKRLQQLAPSVSDSFAKYAESNFIEPSEWDDPASVKKTAEKIKSILSDINSGVKNYNFSRIKSDNLPREIVKSWPSGKATDWSARASVINGLRSAIKNNHIPNSIKAPIMNIGEGDKSAKKSLVKDVLDDLDSFDLKIIEDGSLASLSNLVAAYRILRKNPLSVSEKELSSDMENVVDDVTSSVGEFLEASVFLREWEKALSNFSKYSVKDIEGYKPGDDYSKALGSIDSFFHSPKPLVDPQELVDQMEDRLEKKYGEIPKSLKPAFSHDSENSSSVATSNDHCRGKAMVKRLATYHGLVTQGHPDGPTNTKYKSYDKRYFGKDHYDSILKTAASLMDEDWLKYGWDCGSDDAKYRAALDLAIHTADSNLYQSKIDTETYDMLLNRLAGWGHDSFKDIVLPNSTGSKRSSFSMNTHYQNIVRVANDIRHKDPKHSLEILKSLRALVAGDEATPGSIGGAPVTSPVAQLAPPGGVTDKDTNDFVDGKLNIDDLKSKTKKLVDAKDMDDFLAGLKDLQDIMKKTASGRRANEFTELSPLEDMSDEEVMAFLKDQKARAHEMEKFLSDNDVDSFMQGFDEMLSGAEEAAKQVKTSSVRVKLSTLVRLAKSNSAAGKVLIPFLVAAKKKMDKKKKKPAKKDEEKDEKSFVNKKDEKVGGKDKKAPPFGGKKAPPFAKKDGKKPGKRKASVSILASDVDW